MQSRMKNMKMELKRRKNEGVKTVTCQLISIVIRPSSIDNLAGGSVMVQLGVILDKFGVV
jgi:hypothetical protein